MAARYVAINFVYRQQLYTNTNVSVIAVNGKCNILINGNLLKEQVHVCVCVFMCDMQQVQAANVMPWAIPQCVGCTYVPDNSIHYGTLRSVIG